ncbi:High-molecular-weight cytochrome c [Desulfamplus magnetovallimortis]|uniref:High-molecular-weight cytochrome c n=1 Tax=Desulfamplus magnetovallimortis TaxID=1246637 RepID=A0A1W1HDD3_9BACT|nr:cytochrome c3 family protein [Desulfamplus magnetovallimortis]SLM30489.1 High-molecular-weight cytochrome c [Desulfamplus magnetovallimortis]
MSKLKLSLRLMFAYFAAFLAFSFLEQPHLYGEDESLHKGRSDGIVIDLPTSPGGEQMPGVTFYHDLHTKQLNDKEKDCSVCHMKEPNEDRFVFKYKRLKDSETETDMAVYHDNCIACHEDVKSKSKKSGPLEAQCRECHNTKDGDISSWQPIVFDKSLHNRHETAKAIVSPMGKDEPNCSACHHGYDEKLDKLFYDRGQEGSCRYCHKDSGSAPFETPSKIISSSNSAQKSITLQKASSMRDASHNSCVNCHIVEMKKFAGPVNCSGCHDLEEQKKIDKLQVVPRLKREQPDVAMITGWEPAASMESNQSQEEIEKIVENINQYMKPVVFDHKNHENNTKDCRTCHHDTLKNCKECHTLKGSDKGGFVNLESAMHDIKSDRSCMGCHEMYKAASDCAGCHAQMPEKSFAQTDSSCAVCHVVDAVESGLQKMDKTAMNAAAEALLKAKTDEYQKVANDKIPEKVTIGYIADKYEPSEFPHGKIVKAIEKRIEKSKIANAFHKDGTTLCAGCHHNSLPTEKPQKCISCHGKGDMLKNDGRPGLMGAYHGQCITCHQKMNVETVAATDCNKCHKEKK